MPHMYPETLDGLEIKSPAERKLFNAFQQYLGEDFYVFYSVAWLGIRRGADKPSDGEMDFIIAHPRMGILLIEVKGGLIGRNDQGEWYSVRKDGSSVEIKNPFIQVKENKYALLKKIDSMPNWPGYTPTLGHAVAFPDGTIDLTNLGPEAPRDIILLHENLGNLEQWVRNCMKFWAGDKFVAPGENGVQAICNLLRKSWLLREPKLGEEIGVEAAALKKYTEDQFIVLELLAAQPRAAIRGCAGSGKTLLAVQKAIRLADEGFRTLLTCYNHNLAEFLKRLVGKHPRLKVQSFHGLCYEYAIKIGRDRKPDWDDTYPGFFETIMPEALMEAVASGDETYRFDAIVADEGQDFFNYWWGALEMTLVNPDEGIFYVFYDDNQIVYPHKLVLPVEELAYPLTSNCRNTQCIHRMVSNFYKSDLKIKARGPEGRAVGINIYGKLQNSLRASLTTILTRLIYVENVHPEQIVILSPGGKEKPPLSLIEQPGAHKLISRPSISEDEIYCTTIRLFKGLEKPVVILVVPANSENSDELLYVGLSRGCNHVEVLIDEDLDPAIFVRLKHGRG